MVITKNAHGYYVRFNNKIAMDSDLTTAIKLVIGE